MLKILVPTDYSPEAKNACVYAWNFAKYTSAKLVLYHAMPAVIPASDVPYENYYLDQQEEELLLRDAYLQLLQEHGLPAQDVPFETRVDTHNVIALGIKEAFEQTGCDMVIMGTHGASGIRKVFMGSNTAQLIAIANIPVIAIPMQYRFEPIYHLVYASDLENLEEELGTLIPFAEVFHAALEIFYFDYAGPDSEKLILDAEMMIKNQAYPNIKLNIQKGSIHLSIAENLKRQIDPGNTQMLIMYRAQHGWIDKLLLGSNSQKVLLEPGLPILVMHKQES